MVCVHELHQPSPDERAVTHTRILAEQEQCQLPVSRVVAGAMTSRWSAIVAPASLEQEPFGREPSP
ncbi:TPA: hypothetical protein EYP38_02420 [Candidatus Micrarchaeota archaeon]|nr:hypothetical protein [Candidatus Micrarchaeota archaeon]